ADAAFPYFASVMLPDCDYPELEVCSKWMIWIFLFDDEFDNGHLRYDSHAAKARLDKLRATMANEPSEHESDGMMRIHLEIWNAIKQKDSFNGGMLAQIRYRKAMNGYCDGVLEHVRSSSRQEVPTPEEYLEVRKLSSGCEPPYALVEYAYGLELSDDQVCEPSITKLKDVSTRIALLHNDMISWRKEKIEKVLHNYINTLIKQGFSEKDASAIMLDMVVAEHQKLSDCLEDLATGKITEHHKMDIESVPRVPLANLYWSGTTALPVRKFLVDTIIYAGHARCTNRNSALPKLRRRRRDNHEPGILGVLASRHTAFIAELDITSWRASRHLRLAACVWILI
ncbi:terpenoid synthase, partial [Aureobasidium melanogenum]